MHDGDDENLYTRVESGDPEQCQARTHSATLQCRMRIIQGTHYCHVHRHLSGESHRESTDTRLRRYAGSIWSEDVKNHASDSNIKDLRQEIGILRTMIEQRLRTCKSDIDLMLHSQNLGDLILKVERLVLSCNKIEKDLAGVMDQTQALAFAAELMEIVASNLDGIDDAEDIMENISSDITTRLQSR